MPKLILWASVSIDGYIAGPDGEIDWHQVDDELHTFFNQQLAKAGAFLGGRVSHEMMQEFWPTADQDPSLPDPMHAFAAIWRDMPKILYSRTVEHADWNTTIVREVVPEEVAALKAETNGDLILGGGDLASSFAAHDLIDEYWLFVNPISLGAGLPLFRRPYDAHPLELIETRTFGNGVTLLRYRRDR